MNGRHAYCIIAHNRPDLLNNLVEMIDDYRNDIFVHIDKKSNISEFATINTSKSRLIFLKDRVNVNWGSFSQIESELALFSKAVQTNEYQYVHLLSGIDVPIKSQDEIHDFFDKNYPKEFIGYQHNAFSQRLLSRRADLYHFFTRYGRSGIGKIMQQARRALCVLQRVFHVKRKHSFTMKIGPNWVSLTGDCVSYIVSKKKDIAKDFRYMTCADEIYKHSVIWDSPYKDNVYDINGYCYHGCMRLIDWTRGNPYVFQLSDYNQIIASDRLFCRKVTDIALARKIAEHNATNHS